MHQVLNIKWLVRKNGLIDTGVRTAKANHFVNLYGYPWVCPAGVSSRYPQSPGEGIRSPGAEVTGGCELPNMGAGNSPLEEQEVFSTAEPSF